MTMLEIIRALSPLRMGPNCAGLDDAVRTLSEVLPFDVTQYPGGTEVNGWIVPRRWEVERATISDASGTVVYDGNAHPLGVIGYSRAFTGRVDAHELKRHLYYADAFEDALIYHCDLFYKPFREEWGFSVTKRFFEDLPDGVYDVDLRTTFTDGTMKVAEYVLPGESADSIVLNAHDCHAFCANDDLAGIAVGVEVMRRLAALPRRRFTYRLVVAPEHFGTICYLDSLDDGQLAALKWGVFLEMLGTTQQLTLQRSFTGTSMVDRAITNVLEHSGAEWRSEPFRTVVGNDETCWEAAGYEVPFPCLSRFPYPEYHTSRDSPDLMDESKLDESVRVVLESLFILENDLVMTRRFRGLVALSHPRYDLYKPFWDPSEPGRRTIDETARRWNYLMDCLPRYFDGLTRIIEIAERHGLPFRVVYEYVRDFEAKGLIETAPAPACDPPVRSLPPR